MIEETCTGDSIRERLEEFRSTPLVQDEKYRNQGIWYPGTWSSADGRFQLNLRQLKHYAFRSGALARADLKIFDGNVTLGAGCRVNLYVTRWLEPIPGPTALLPGLSKPGGLISHVAVERINFANEVRHAIDGLNEADLEKLARLIEPAMQEFLQRSVAQEQKEQKWRGEHGVPVAGKLHWRWRRPAPELVRFHDLCAAFAREATVARVKDLPLDRYRKLPDATDKFDQVLSDDPTVAVAVPGIDRDDPYFRVVEVRFGDVVIPVEIHDLGSNDRMAHHELALSDDDVHSLRTYLLIHPQSRLLKPKKAAPPVDERLADAAAEHARNVWLRIWAPFRPAMVGYRGAREGQVRISDVIII